MSMRILGLALVLSCGGPAATGAAPSSTDKPDKSARSSWTGPTSRDTHDDPARVRPGYGNAEAHTWFPPGSTSAEGASIAERMLAYQREAHALFDQKAYRTLVKMLDIVALSISDAAKSASSQPDTMSAVAWLMSYYSLGLAIVGRGDEALGVANDVLDHFDDHWTDSNLLRSNAVVVIDDRMLELMASKDYENATHVPSKHLDACRADAPCSSNLSVVYRNWAIEKSNAGDWPAAREILQRCVAALPDNEPCKSSLSELESRHHF